MRPNRRGFTLIEVMIALTIGTLVVLLAHQLFAAVVERGRALISARAALDREMNARRWVAATFLSLAVGTDQKEGFDGQPDRIAFTAWERTAEGWFERRHLTLGLEASRLVATLRPDAPVALLDSVGAVAFDYLLETGADARWVREWVSAVSAPIAVRVRVRRENATEADTLLLLIKERG